MSRKFLGRLLQYTLKRALKTAVGQSALSLVRVLLCPKTYFVRDIYKKITFFLIFSTKSGRVYRLGLRCGAVWLVAVACWLNDRLFCDTWMNWNFPYLHALWHLFIFIASYTAAVLFAYFSVQDEKPQQTPILRYWPKDNFELGVPYIKIRSYVTNDVKNPI